MLNVVLTRGMSPTGVDMNFSTNGQIEYPGLSWGLAAGPAGGPQQGISFSTCEGEDRINGVMDVKP